LLDVQRAKLTRLRGEGKIDNTVLRRVQRVLDLQAIDVQLLGATGHPDDLKNKQAASKRPHCRLPK